MKAYGIKKKENISSEFDYHLENIKLKGFSIAASHLDENTCDMLSEDLERVYTQQQQQFGKDRLDKIQETDMVRMPFFQSASLKALIFTPLILSLAKQVLGDVFILHLQNGILNRPSQIHHQTSWHRDLPYQEWVCSKPLGFNAFCCLSDFTEENGATFVLPHSHKTASFPSERYVEENAQQMIAPKGSIIFFDSMIYHRAGINYSEKVRYGVNIMFVVPILKQQIDIATHFQHAVLTQQEAQIFGVPYKTPQSVFEFRNQRLNKIET